MQYEDIVYNAGILAMAARLEKFLEEWASKEWTGGPLKDKYKCLQAFCDSRETDLKGMHRLFKRRDDIAHERVITGEDGFNESREDCVEVDNRLANMTPRLEMRLPRMGEVMISCSLRYDMGNAGDLIKHGLLAEFAEWRAEEGEFRYADPFGGRPWGRPNLTVQKRLKLLNPNCALWKAQKEGECVKVGSLYYGSSHVVLNAAQKRAVVFADDSDKIARADLKASGLLRVISDEFRDQKYDGNGYSILEPEMLKAGRFNLILIDPYADFLEKELSASEDGGHFRKIKRAIEHPDNRDLWVAVFVLVGDDKRDRYAERRERFFGGQEIALRCPRMPGCERQPDGETRYDMEILLVSSCLQEHSPRIKKLRERIANFKDAAEWALSEGKIRAWGLEEVNE